jgi:SAM-dependent methyltransferase
MTEYDPTLYQGSAPHYLSGRPPYSDELGAVLSRELQLDGSGVLLDVGCGPGVLAVQLAPHFVHVLAVDPDPGMISEARRHAERQRADVTCLLARAEDLPTLGLPPMRMVTFGQSFHWTEGERVAELVYDLLEPGGAIVLVAPDIDARPVPEGPGEPPIPHDEIEALISAYLGPDRRAGQGLSRPPPDRYEVTLARTRFGPPVTVHAPAREDLTRDIGGVISGYLSTSFAAPHLFGDRLEQFVDDARRLMEGRTTSGRFWDWPGDTAMIIGRKPFRS